MLAVALYSRLWLATNLKNHKVFLKAYLDHFGRIFLSVLKIPWHHQLLLKFAFPVQLAILSEPNESLFKLYGKKIPQCIQMKPTDGNYLNKYTRNGLFSATK